VAAALLQLVVQLVQRVLLLLVVQRVLQRLLVLLVPSRQVLPQAPLQAPLVPLAQLPVSRQVLVQVLPSPRALPPQTPPPQASAVQGQAWWR